MQLNELMKVIISPVDVNLYGQLPRPIKGPGLAKGLIPLYLSEVCSSRTWS